MTAIKIRQLDIHDANDFRTIRLSGLQNNPEMFGSTYAVESKRSLALFADSLLIILFYINSLLIKTPRLYSASGF